MAVNNNIISIDGVAGQGMEELQLVLQGEIEIID